VNQTPEERARALDELHDAMARLEELYQDMELACTDPDTDPGWLASTARNETWSVLRPLVAANPGTPRSTREHLLSGGEDEVLVGLAANPGLETDLLEQLLTSKRAKVLAVARRHPGAPVQALLDVEVTELALKVNREVASLASVDMVLALSQGWVGTLGELLDSVEALDEECS
jgi:hypothetical protein